MEGLHAKRVGIRGRREVDGWRSGTFFPLDENALNPPPPLPQAYFALVTGLLVSPASLHQYAGLGPFWHREIEIILGNREVFFLPTTDIQRDW